MISWRDRPWWLAGPAAGVALGAADSIVNHVPVWLGEVSTARTLSSRAVPEAALGAGG